MTPDEQKVYQRGYRAGKAKARRDRSAEHAHRERQAFWDKAFLAAIPACIRADGWKVGDKPITSLVDRIDLARDAADHAAKKRRYIL